MHKPKRTVTSTTQTEEEWEETILTESLSDAMKPDGSIDFDKLRAGGQAMTPDELYPEGSADNES